MHQDFIKNSESAFYADDIEKMYQMGFLYDLRASSIAFSLLLIIFYIFYFTKSKISLKLYNFWAFFACFVLCFFAFLGYFYYQTYNSKIDIFIFNFFNDDTLAASLIILQNYPVFKALLFCLIFAFFGMKIANALNKITLKTNIFIKIFLNILFLLAYVVAIRGSVSTFPLREQDNKISDLASINHISQNPVLALVWAKKHYDSSTKFYEVLASDLKQKYFALFNENILKSTPKNDFLAKNPPNVVFNLMESFGINFLLLDDNKHDLLRSLRKHFKQDFVFTRFLPAHNGTAPSFAGIFYLSPYSNISFSTKKTHKLELTPFDVYKKAGYKVYFVTSANTSWQNLNEYLKVLGVDVIYDMHDLIKDYPEAKHSINPYGVADEYIYKKVLNILKTEAKPSFIAILTTSNHPPFFIPKHFDAKMDFSDEFFANFTNDTNEFRKNSAKAYAYANDCFGKFLDQLKELKIGEKTIVAATGDHHNRDIKAFENDNLLNNFAVPLYLYVPKDYQFAIFYDNLRAGSHKDIFPTLYELSLSGAKYLNLGGKNMLTKPANPRLEFGINDSFYVDNSQIYNGFSAFDLNEDLKTFDGFVVKNQNITNKNSIGENSADKNSITLDGFFKAYMQIYFDETNYRLGKNYKENDLL